MTLLAPEQYRLLVERAPIMIWHAGADGEPDYFNSSWLRFVGRTLEEAIREGAFEPIHPDDREHYLARHREHVERVEAFHAEYRLRAADGSYHLVHSQVAPLADEHGVIVGFAAACFEVDEHQGDGAGSEISDFFEESLDHVCIAGLDGYFKRVSASWTKTLGWTAAELKSSPILDFVHPDDRDEVLAQRRLLKAGVEMGRVVNRYRHKDGSYRWFEWRSSAQADRVFAIARDVTEQKHTEERLRRTQENEAQLRRQLIFADRMASVGTLAGGIAHEINNPLGVVSTNLALMLEELEDEPGGGQALRDMVGAARLGADRIAKIVRNLATFSRAEEEHRDVVELQPLLELSIETVANELRHRAALVRQFGPTPPVLADEARLGQVFINLLVNAAQALPESGASTNEIRVVTSTDAQGRAVVEVQDTGDGIPEELLERIFDPFYTTKPVGIGTGLGLSVCHTLVTDIGGEIMVESEEGRGTTVRIVLPAATRARPDPQPVEAPTLETTGLAVLVVDDEPALGALLGRILRDDDVTFVTSAREALEILDAGDSFDVIVSDLMMPEMSGIEFYEAVCERHPDAAPRIVFVTGGAFTPDSHAFLDRVPNEVVRKPFTPAQIRDAASRVARGQR